MRVHNSILSISTVVLFLLLGILPVAGQNNLQIYVKGFEYDPTDLTASNINYRKTDGNGDVYAIVKVKSDTPGDDLNAYNFNFGMMSSTKEVHGDELWLYVQKNAKTVTITRQGYASIQRYDLKIAIQPACTYTLTLSSQKPIKQFCLLQFKVTPQNEPAVIKVKKEGADSDYEIWGTVAQDGTIDRRLELGNYLYKIVLDKYNESEGRIELNGLERTHVESVVLSPNFGYIEVLSDIKDYYGANVFIDDRNVGVIPYKTSERFECGTHKLSVISESIKTYSDVFAVKSGETTTLKPQLESAFADITIKTAENAEIWINDKLYGSGTWKGRLKDGIYDVESRLPKHVSSIHQIHVNSGVAETFNIGAPKPITGGLYISSTPSGAQILIDDASSGHFTPDVIDSVLIGNHKISLLLDNYKAESKTVSVNEGEVTDIKFTLTPGNSRNHLPKPVHQHSDSFQRKICMYLQAGYQYGSCSMAALTFGTYLSGFNVEASVLLGTAYSEQVYWWNPNKKMYNTVRYKASASVGIKAGYGLMLGRSYRLTPQLGYTHIVIKGASDKCYAGSGSVGFRFDFSAGSHIGLFVAPEYDYCIIKSDSYKVLSGISSSINGFGTGFNVRAGLSFFL